MNKMNLDDLIRALEIARRSLGDGKAEVYLGCNDGEYLNRLCRVEENRLGLSVTLYDTH